MEAFIYFTVRLIAAIYLLYKIWIWLFCGAAAKRIWDKIPVRNPRGNPEPKPCPVAGAVVGATKTTVLEVPLRGMPTIAAGTDLEPTGYAKQRLA